MNSSDLLELKEKIEKKKEDLAGLKANRKLYLTELKKKYDCSTVAEAEKFLKKLRVKINGMNTELEEQLEKIESALDEGDNENG